VRCGPETGYATQLTLHPPQPEASPAEGRGEAHDSGEEGRAADELERQLGRAVARWRALPHYARVEMVSLGGGGDGWLIRVPGAPGHEEHFGMVLESFLDFIADHTPGEGIERWPATLPAAMRMRYTLLANAAAMEVSVFFCELCFWKIMPATVSAKVDTALYRSRVLLANHAAGAAPQRYPPGAMTVTRADQHLIHYLGFCISACRSRDCVRSSTYMQLAHRVVQCVACIAIMLVQR
jgi:hypothetical protein